MHDHFIKSIHLSNKRRYKPNILFTENHPVLYDHFDLCKNRLEKLFEKLKNDKKVLKKYITFSQNSLSEVSLKESPKIAK